MKKIVRLTESDLHNIIKESVKMVLREGVYTPNQSSPQQYGQQINNSNMMQIAVNNGGQSQEANDYIANTNTYYGAIAKIAKENNTTYTDTLSDLQEKIKYYLENGYFGQKEEVTNTIQLFAELLSYLHGAYESAVSKIYGNRMNEGFGDWVNGLRFKDTNSFGVKQKIRDKSNSKYAVDQRNGQWMTDLQNELKQLLEWNFLHGKKTVDATNAFIQFLNVEKRGAFPLAWKNIKIMYGALIGLTMLMSVGDTNGTSPNQQQFNQPTTQEVQSQQTQNINVGFNINSAEISNEYMQSLQSLKNVNAPITIVVHESQNSNGKDSSYESHLALQRAQAIMNVIGKQCKVVRGSNSQNPYAEIQIGSLGWGSF